MSDTPTLADSILVIGAMFTGFILREFIDAIVRRRNDTELHRNADDSLWCDYNGKRYDLVERKKP